MWPAGLRLANNMIPIAGAVWMVPLLCGPWLNWLVIFTIGGNFTWWRHQMETFSALLATCAGNSPEFPAQRPVTRSFDVLFDLCLNKRLSKPWQGWWFETLSRPLWRHRNEYPLKDLSKDFMSLEAAWLLFRVLLWLWYMFVVSTAMLSKYLSNTKSMILLHYIDVIMSTVASQITSLAVVYSSVYLDANQRKHQSSASLDFVWGIHRDRWIPRTKGQLRGKCFHLMTSSWKHSIAWLRHRVRSNDETFTYV